VRSGSQAVAALAALLATANPALAEPTQYVCIAEHSGGLHFDRQTGTWHAQVFVPGKYILRRVTDRDRDRTQGKWWSSFEHHPDANWAFFDFGKDDPIPLTVCVEGKDDWSSRNLKCTPVVFVHDAHFDKETRRFEVIVSGAYVSQGYWEQLRREDPEEFKQLPYKHDPSSPDDLFIQIGMCSPS
jgi:hypothetical protein